LRTPEAVLVRRRWAAAIALILGLLGLGLVVRGPSASGAGQGVQATTTIRTGTTVRSAGSSAGTASSTSTTALPDTTMSVVTTVNLLTGQVAATTTTSTTIVSEPDNSATAHRTVNWKVWGIVAGLVFVALVMAVLTWRYWRKTRPHASNVVRSGEAFTVTSAFDAPRPTAAPGGGVEPTAEASPSAAARPVVATADPAFLDQLAAEAARGAGGVVQPASVDLPAVPGPADPNTPGRSTRSRRRGSRFADLEISLPPSDDARDGS